MLGIHQDHPHRRIEMKFCVVGGLEVVVLRYESHQNRPSGFGTVGGGWNLHIPIDLAIVLYNSLYYSTSRDISNLPGRHTWSPFRGLDIVCALPFARQTHRTPRNFFSGQLLNYYSHCTTGLFYDAVGRLTLIKCIAVFATAWISTRCRKTVSWINSKHTANTRLLMEFLENWLQSNWSSIIPGIVRGAAALADRSKCGM